MKSGGYMYLGNLIRNEWWLNRRNFLISIVIIVGFQALFAGVSDIYLNNQDIIGMLESMPPALMQGFGIHVDQMTSFEGWMSSEPLLFYMMLFGGFAAVWSSLAISRERSAKSADFLFSLPYSRTQIYLSRAVAHLLQMLVVYLISLGSVYILGSMFSTIEHPSVIWVLMTSGLLVSMAFAGMGYILTVLVSTERAALTYSVGIVMLSFLLKMLAGMSEAISWLSKLSLFTIFDGKSMITDSVLPWTGIVVCLSIYVVGLGIGCLLLNRQDI